MTREDLIAFERGIAELFNAGKIRAPVHLDGGNEEQLIEIFGEVRPHDWLCGSWRQHYHCLLKGVAPERLEADIRAGRSISLCYPEHRIVSSAIVAGVIPIALGIAWSIKRAGGAERVWCFLGDMTSTTGTFDECLRYAEGHALPIRFVIEDNGKSVCTDTKEVWGSHRSANLVHIYRYDLPFPHAGAGQRVQF